MATAPETTATGTHTVHPAPGPCGRRAVQGAGTFSCSYVASHHPPSLGSRAPASASRTPSALAVCSPSTRLVGAQVLHPHTFIQVQGSGSGR